MEEGLYGSVALWLQCVEGRLGALEVGGALLVGLLVSLEGEEHVHVF